MIDYLIVVLLFASLPLGIILTFVGCFYCFLLLQHCLTYTEEDPSDARSDETLNSTRRDVRATTPVFTVITEASLDGIGGGRGRQRNAYSVSPAIGGRRGIKRLDSDFMLPQQQPQPQPEARCSPAESDIADSTATTNTVTDTEDVPPPPYNIICFDKENNASSRRNSNHDDHDGDGGDEDQDTRDDDDGSPTICISTV